MTVSPSWVGSPFPSNLEPFHPELRISQIGVTPKSETVRELTVCSERGVADGSQVCEVHAGVPRGCVVAASDRAERIWLVPGVGHLAPAFVSVAGQCGARSAAAAQACCEPRSGERAAQEAARGKDSGGGFFQGCLRANRGSTPERERVWRDGIFAQVRAMMQLEG